MMFMSSRAGRHYVMFSLKQDDEKSLYTPEGLDLGGKGRGVVREAMNDAGHV